MAEMIKDIIKKRIKIIRDAILEDRKVKTKKGTERERGWEPGRPARSGKVVDI